MRKLLFILAVVVLLLGCKQNVSLPNALYFGDELKLLPEVPVQVIAKRSSGAEGDPVVIKVASINDSRCPTGVSCMWAGKADVALSLGTKNGETVNLNLCLGQCANKTFNETDSSTITLDGIKYKLVLLQINPYPTTENATQQKTVVVKVEEAI
ncbi:hypothetical protein [Pontibacter cellulosilyticus]|uniref:Lipoprotein n=1 Tax=Pontibacter cellulosilyticus TaxID=1720253 RepID=A0A923N696_9BACT|nr:hypothetical protein [Pontibacter cellulosilyticus]MBC5993418.1 hypothetical protein [Pontibacter cellulosilyticus]